MIADVREKLRGDESLASVDVDVDVQKNVEIDVDVDVGKVRVLEKRESMRAGEKRRKQDFMVFGQLTKVWKGTLQLTSYLRRRGCIRLEKYFLRSGAWHGMADHAIRCHTVLYRTVVPPYNTK
jgi:hypothetical protein